MARSHQVAARGWQSKRRAESTRCEALRVSEVRHINQIRGLRTREVNSTRNLELFSFSEDDDVFGRAGVRYFGQAVENTTIPMRRRSLIFILRVLVQLRKQPRSLRSGKAGGGVRFGRHRKFRPRRSGRLDCSGSTAFGMSARSR